jgi:hypothetical protein
MHQSILVQLCKRIRSPGGDVAECGLKASLEIGAPIAPQQRLFNLKVADERLATSDVQPAIFGMF